MRHLVLETGLSLRLGARDTGHGVLVSHHADAYCFRIGYSPLSELDSSEESTTSPLNKLELSRADQYLMWGLKRLTQEMSLKAENLP